MGELFDYVNGVCNPLDAFGKGEYGPLGENVTNRAVLAGTYHAPLGFELSVLGQAESARPFTLTTPDGTERAVVNGVETTMDEFRGTPFSQTDLRVSRPFTFRDHGKVTPFVGFFNLFNRNNPGANYVTNVAGLTVNNTSNITALCLTGAGRSAGRLLRTWYHRGHTVYGAIGNPPEFLAGTR